LFKVSIFFELGELSICEILHKGREPCALSIKEVSQNSIFVENGMIPKSEILGWGVAPLWGVNVPVYPSEFLGTPYAHKFAM